MNVTTDLKYLRYELDDAKTILGMMIPNGETAEEKFMYLLGRRDSVCYLLESIVDGMDDLIRELDGEQEEEPEKTMWDKLKEVQNVNAL